MWCSGSIKGQKIWRCAIYAARSRSLMASSPLGFSSVSRHCGVVSPMGGIQTNHCVLGNFQTSPILFRDVYVSPVHVGRCGLIYLKWVGLSAKEQIRCYHRFSSSCTCAVRSTLLPSAVSSALYNLLNITVAPDISGTALCSKPKIQNHFCL